MLHTGSSWNLPFLRNSREILDAFDRTSGFGPVDRPVGQEAAELERADAVQLAVFGFDGRKHAGVDVRRQGQVAVRRDVPMIGQPNLKTLPSAKG